MKVFTKAVKFLIWLFFLTIIFTFNIYLINQGSGFTIPRELLFRTEAEILRPIIFFPIILLFLFLIKRFLFPLFKKLSQSKKIILIFTFCLTSAFSLFNIVQTNPDYGRYLAEAKYLNKNGIIAYFQNWGNFQYAADMPVMPFIYGVAFKLFGEGQLAVLIVNLLIFLGILWLTYLIARQLFNKKIAFFSIILFSTTPFVITQTPLFLVDLGQTFFLTLSFYLLVKIIQSPSIKQGFIVGLVLFITSLTKIFSIIFIIPFLAFSFIWAISKKRKKKIFHSLTTAWGFMMLLDLVYFFWKRDIFYELIFQYISPKEIILSVESLAVVGVFSLIIIILARKNLNRFYFAILPIIYLLLVLLFFYGQKRAFYLRTIFVAANIPLAILFFSSIYFAFKKKSISALMLLPWSSAAIFIPNTMFKYQLPSYPAIMMLTTFSLISLFKNHKRQIRCLLVALAFSISITYFFFLPMIQNHIKVNIRQAAEYANQFQPKKIVVLFFPIGEYGEELSKYIDETSKFPTPSLTHLIDYYTAGEVVYETEEEFLKNLDAGQIPDILFLTTHLNHSFKLSSQLKVAIDKYFIEGPTFDQANGAGIWRVKIKPYRYAEQQ